MGNMGGEHAPKWLSLLINGKTAGFLHNAVFACIVGIFQL